ncbi:helix-turn-helix transcriptional regulator [Geminicoccus sp.]|jgi:transcriptional regulator with XRE-family HTH domain|uniref:helix-turn-helix domain-containing protein n=1 Tax=Geminicoccus sp. TaxID=2024832 RepID=UPI0032C216D3
MARAALGWNASQLATAANVGITTITRFETGQSLPIPNTLAAIQRALEQGGIEFIPDEGTGPGVRLLRKNTPLAHDTLRLVPARKAARRP